MSHLNPKRFVFNDIGVRVLQEDAGALWFVAADVAAALDFEDSLQLTRQLKRGRAHAKSFLGTERVLEMAALSLEGMRDAISLAPNKRLASACKTWLAAVVLEDLEKAKCPAPQVSPTAAPQVSPTAAPEMTVGDLHSTAPGSAARASAGKAPLDLIDLRVLADSLPRDSTERSQVVIVLELLGDYQMGGQPLALDAALGTVLALTTTEDVAAVLDYGRRKYPAWNWSKGFQWSVPLGSAARHLLAIHRGVQHDHESGLSHWAHVWCNLMMLGAFIRDYPAGNDFPWQVNQTDQRGRRG